MPPRLRALSNAWLTGALLVAATASGQAADQPKEASFGKSKAGSAYLTRDQLRACLSQQARLAQLDRENLKDQTELVATEAEIVRSGTELKAQLAALDRTSPDAVDAYNERTKARDKEIDDLEARVPRFNERVEAARSEREAFAKGCANRGYFEDDEIAIRQGK